MKPPPMRPLYIGVALLLVFAIFVVWLREGRSHAGALKRESN